MVKKILNIVIWSTLGTSCIVLLVAAMKKTKEKSCGNVIIEISGPVNQKFVNKEDVLQVLMLNGIEKNKPVTQINLKNAEEALEKNAWIKNAELFFDNNQTFYATVTEREPIARVFTITGNSFYIDSNSFRLPVIKTMPARLPVFTSFPSDKQILSHPDSSVLNNVTTIAKFINRDSFWSAQIAQINFTTTGMYELIPVLGNQVIELGDANDLEKKFAKLFCFYQQVWAKTGFEKYARIKVQFKDQIVAEKRGATKPWRDTAKAVKQFSNADKVMNKVIRDTAFASSVEKANSSVAPLNAKDVETTIISTHKSQEEKEAPTKMNQKKEGDTISKKIPKAVMKKLDENNGE